MELEYLLNEHTKYEGCQPIRLDGQLFFLPPSETGQTFVDDLVTECIRFLLTRYPGARIDDAGEFYTLVNLGRRGTSQKRQLNHIGSVPELLESMRSAGYSLPEDYWYKRRNELKRLVR